jgi:sugar (pentulose or hexulose) kinase
MICLGLDIGSTTIKGAVLDLVSREVSAVTARFFPQPIPGLPAGHFEVDPRSIVEAAEAVLAALLREAPDPAAIFFAGQMGGVILIDEADEPLSNYLSWRDQRTLNPYGPGGNALDAIRSLWNDSELVDVGNELQPGSASSLLYWLAVHKALPPRSMPATVADFVIGRLCGEVPQMDRTQAIGLIDLRTGDWHRQAFAKLGLDRLRWPRIADVVRPIGCLRWHGRAIPCHASTGDQQTALYGAGLARDEISINVSTGSQVSRRTACFAPGPYQTRCYLAGDYLNTITHLPAGRSLNALVDLLTELASAEGHALTNVWQTIAAKAADADGGGLAVDMAFFAGPLGDRGGIDGITTDNLTVGNLFRAAFENMARNYARCAERLAPNLSLEKTVLSGGLVHGVPVLQELIQQRLAAPLRVSDAAEETLVGLLEIASEVYFPLPSCPANR